VLQVTRIRGKAVTQSELAGKSTATGQMPAAIGLILLAQERELLFVGWVSRLGILNSIFVLLLFLFIIGFASAACCQS
jgi:hypothetical protein